MILGFDFASLCILHPVQIILETAKNSKYRIVGTNRTFFGKVIDSGTSIFIRNSHDRVIVEQNLRVSQILSPQFILEEKFKISKNDETQLFHKILLCDMKSDV